MPPMNEHAWLTELFQQHKGRLRAVAYRMLGSVAEAEDALQEAWLRIRDQDPRAVENMQAWLTTVVGRVCLNMLRSRRSRRETFSDVHVPDPVVTLRNTPDPEQQALLADSVGLALLVVLDSLTPDERLAFVLHDVFGVPFSEIAGVLDRSEAAAQQLASRARRRVQGSPTPDRDLSRQRRVVDAFFAAARNGDFDALLQILHPDVELRIDGGKLRRELSVVLHGAKAVAAHTRRYARLYPYIVPTVVNGAAGVIIAPNNLPYAVIGFAISGDRITAMDVLVDPERLNQLDLTIP
jgi:RNA polymerase sigma-70 factor, ECF subfamily